MRRLVIGNALSALLLTLIILLSTISADVYLASTSGPIFTNASVAKHFTITGSPASTTAGQSFSGITVTVYNSNGKVATDYCGTVYFTSTDQKAILPYTSQCKYTFTTGQRGDKGVHTFSGFNLETAVSQTITVTDGSMSATTNIIIVNAAAPTSIQITPKTATVASGSSQSYTATAKDYFCNSWDVTALTTWNITAGAGGSWSRNVYTSAQAGAWTVTCTYSNLCDSASLTVAHTSAANITITQKTASVTAGSNQTYTVLAFDSHGNNWDVTSSVSWSISSGASGSWSSNVYTSSKAGVWTVTATMGCLSDTALLTVTHNSPVNITVSPKNPAVIAGNTQAFAATANDLYGNTWDVSSSTIWFIDSGAVGSWLGNVYTSAKAGTWRITAVYSGFSDIAYLTVDYGPISAIAISPKTATLMAGSSQNFTATASDIYGNVWAVSNSTVWSISSGAGGSWQNNQYTAALTGQWTVTGSSLGVSGTASLTVTHASPVRITVSLSSNSVIAGSNLVCTATATDSFGNAWDATASTVWVIDSGASGTWNGNVYVSAKAGTWRVSGVYTGLSDSASVKVNPGSPISLTVSPKTVNLAAGSSQSYIATASDGFGNSWDVSGSTVWSIDSAAEGSWSGNVYTASKAGTWTITGSFNGLSDTASLIATHGVALDIVTNPATESIVAGSTVTFTTMAFDSFGNGWDSTDSACFLIDPQAGGNLYGNNYTSVNAGTWIVTVESLSLFDVVSLTVTHASPVSIAVSPNSASISAGSVQACTATASDSFNNVWDVTNLTAWSISAGAGGSWASNLYNSSAAGSWIVTGTYDTFTDCAYLTVNHSSAVSVNVSPQNAAITTDSNEAFTALAVDAYNNTWDATAGTVWVADSGAEGSWLANVYTSAKAGVWKITGVYSGLSNTSFLTVNHGSALSVTVSPASSTLIAGSSQTFTATASDSNGNQWDVTDSTNWNIDAGAGGFWLGNTYTSNNVGNWTITGTYYGLSSTAALTVNHSFAVNITVGPNSDTIIAGSQETFTSTASDFYGNTWNVTASTTWSIDSGAGGSLSGNIYTSALAGVWNVTGTFGSSSKSFFLTVNHASAIGISVNPYSATVNAGSNEAYTVTAVDSFGNNWDVTSSATWSVDSSAGGSWSANIYSPAKTGTWTINATVASLSATASITVNHGSTSSITVSPQTQTIIAGSSQPFTATAYDSYGNSWNATALTVWSINTGSGGSWVNNVYTSANAGSWEVTGTFNGVTDATPLTVIHGAISTIIVNPSSALIDSDSSQSYTATALDSNGNAWDITNLTSWFISVAAGGSWSASVCTASNPGNWTVTASFGGKSGTAQLIVNDLTMAPYLSTIDFNRDGTVNFGDLVYFIDAYNQYCQNGGFDHACDMNHDGQMNLQDVVLLIDAYDAYGIATYSDHSHDC